jgi:hypothetical protein
MFLDAGGRNVLGETYIDALRAIIVQDEEIRKLKECLTDAVGIIEASECGGGFHKEVKAVHFLDDARNLLGIEP